MVANAVVRRCCSTPNNVWNIVLLIRYVCTFHEPPLEKTWDFYLGRYRKIQAFYINNNFISQTKCTYTIITFASLVQYLTRINYYVKLVLVLLVDIFFHVEQDKDAPLVPENHNNSLM